MSQPGYEYEHVCFAVCLTIDGRQCKFPFVFGNASHPKSEHHACSTLGLHKPWCATEVNEDNSVVEWGECLADCPSEMVQVVCMEDPVMPLLSDGSGRIVNFSTSFEFGMERITYEFDYVAYTCPDGYVFRGTRNTTHYAFCYDWKFITLFDPSRPCVCKCFFLCFFFCICNQKFVVI